MSAPSSVALIAASEPGLSGLPATAAADPRPEDQARAGEAGVAAADPRRLRWQCRRGMLELDQLLLPFLDTGFASLGPAEQGAFVRLLGQRDPYLSDWFMGRAAAPDPELRALVALILETVGRLPRDGAGVPA